MHEKILQTLFRITEISNNEKFDFKDQLQRILDEIVRCMNTKNGSIMILKGRKQLEIMASTREELVGMKQSIDQDSPSSWVVKNKKLLYSDSHKGDQTFADNAGRYKKEAFIVVPILSYQKVVGVLSVTEKIGTDSFSQKEQESIFAIAGHVISALENHRLNESLKKSKGTLKKKNVKLRKLEQIRKELFNMLIHDLKGPISEVVANLDILSYTVKDDENIEYVKAAQTGCDTLFTMVSDLLDIARLEEGSLKLLYEKIKPTGLIKESLSRLHVQSWSKGIKLVDKFNPTNKQMSLYGDRRCLLRVLQNLLSNAIHHSPPEDNIEAGFYYDEPDKISFYVKDNGPGVPMEYKASIFNKFMQIGKKDDGRTYTTGLGLTFCKMAVEAHKGTIHVESDGEKGSCFIFKLPLK